MLMMRLGFGTCESFPGHVLFRATLALIEKTEPFNSHERCGAEGMLTRGLQAKNAGFFNIIILN